MCCDYLPTTSPHYPCSFHSTHPQILFPFCFPCILLPTATLYYLILPSLNLFQELFLDLYQHVCIYFLFLFFFFWWILLDFIGTTFPPKFLDLQGIEHHCQNPGIMSSLCWLKKNTGMPSSLPGIFRENPRQFYLRVVMQNVLSLASTKTSILLSRLLKTS